MEDDDEPEWFICPISQSLIKDPVILSDGHTYEREVIMTWLQSHNTSPLTNEPLTSTEIKSNFALKSAIDDYVKRRKMLKQAFENKKKEDNILAEWLKKLELSQYTQTFDEQGYDSKEAISTLTREDLKEMKVKPGHAKLILDQINVELGHQRPDLDLKRAEELRSLGFIVDVKEGQDDVGDQTVPRVIMPCGHKFSPSSLRTYLSSFMENESCTDPIICFFAKSICLSKRWNWDGIVIAACLTNEEITKYELRLSENLTIQEGGTRCPECKEVSYRTGPLKRVICDICAKSKISTVFCFTCGKKWAGMSCQRCDDINQLLKECQTSVVSGMVVPSIRVCPRRHTSPVLVEIDNDCKHMRCPRCLLGFCFGCLSLQSNEGSWSCGGKYSACPKVAQRQSV